MELGLCDTETAVQTNDHSAEGLGVEGRLAKLQEEGTERMIRLPPGWQGPCPIQCPQCFALPSSPSIPAVGLSPLLIRFHFICHLCRDILPYMWFAIMSSFQNCQIVTFYFSFSTYHYLNISFICQLGLPLAYTQGAFVEWPAEPLNQWTNYRLIDVKLSH